MIINIDKKNQSVDTGDLMLTRFGHRLVVRCHETGRYGAMSPEGEIKNMEYDTLQELLGFYEPYDIISSKRLQLIATK